MKMMQWRMTGLVAALALATAAHAQEGPEAPAARHAMVEGVPGGIYGPACALSSLTSALVGGKQLDVPPFYLRGLSGDAFLATVCQNNCGCRDYREMQLRVLPVLHELGFPAAEYVAEPKLGAEGAWQRVSASLDAGMPVVVFNLFGDWEDVPLVGYDEGKDLAWGLRSDGSEEAASVPLEAWRAQQVFGYVPGEREDEDVDLRAVEMRMLLAAVAAERRPRLDGG